METNLFHKSRQKYNIQGEDVFFESDDEFDFAGEDLEIISDDLSVDVSEVIVDPDYLTNIKQKIDTNEKLIKLMDDDSTTSQNITHPMDAYLKQLILDVLIQDFLPILEKRLTSITK